MLCRRALKVLAAKRREAEERAAAEAAAAAAAAVAEEEARKAAAAAARTRLRDAFLATVQPLPIMRIITDVSGGRLRSWSSS